MNYICKQLAYNYKCKLQLIRMIDFFFQLSRRVFTFVNSIFGAHIMLKNKNRVTCDMLLCF